MTAEQIQKQQENTALAVATGTSASSPAWLLEINSGQMSTLEKLATFVAKSAFAKDINSMEKAITVMLQGMELGLQPMAAVRNIHIIEGRPTLSADLMAALVIKHGHPRIQVEALSEQSCTVRARRRDETEWQEFTFTWHDAVKAQLAGKKNWQAHPKSMLRARAISGICHIVFPDLFAGVYVPEEMDGSMLAAEGDYQVIDTRSGEVVTTTVERESAPVFPHLSQQVEVAAAATATATAAQPSNNQTPSPAPGLPVMKQEEFLGWLKEMKVTAKEVALALSDGRFEKLSQYSAVRGFQKGDDFLRLFLKEYVEWMQKNRPEETNWLWDSEGLLPVSYDELEFGAEFEEPGAVQAGLDAKVEAGVAA